MLSLSFAITVDPLRGLPMSLIGGTFDERERIAIWFCNSIFVTDPSQVQ